MPRARALTTRCMSMGSMLPPESTATIGTVGLHGARHDRGDRDRAGGLDDELRALEQHEQGARDVVFGDRDDLVDRCRG